MAQKVYTTWPWPPPIIDEEKLPKEVDVDTLISIYMSRPVQQIAVGFGAWFTNGLDLDDRTLEKLEGTAAKQYIANAGYNALPHICARLSAYNEMNSLSL